MTSGDDLDMQRVMLHARQFAAQNAIVNELIRLLIMNGVLQQALVVSSYERLSADLMKVGSVEGVQLADIVRDFAASYGRKLVTA